MSNRIDKKARNGIRRIAIVSTLFLIVLIALSSFLNIYLQPWADVLIHVQNSRDLITQEIENIPLNSDTLNKFRVVEATYGVLIESVTPDGSVSYSTFGDEIYVGKHSLEKVDDKDIISPTPIEDTIKIDEKSVENVKIYNLKKLTVLNTKSDYLLYEVKLGEKSFQSGNTLRIYFAIYDYYSTLKESGINRVIINSVVLIFAWLILNSVIMRVYSKIKKTNLVVKKMTQLDFSEKCTEDNTDIGKLGRNINSVVKNAQEKIDFLTEENEKIKEKLDAKERLEDEKKDFLANAAHEMKTPIAIIQGYAEGLKMGIAKGGRARQEYCNIIMDETKKMNKLVLELLELSKYRQKMYEDVKEENFSIRSFVQGIINSMDPILKENSIDIENTINRKLIGRTDIEKANLVLSNYISNAVSHTNMYKKIVISCEEKANAYRINVFNSGDHISEENLKNIWDSFYRVDKSHSRSEGRFGIGLSIVETIQNALKMDYGVENVYGGVQFWFDVKKPGDNNDKK